MLGAKSNLTRGFVSNNVEAIFLLTLAFQDSADIKVSSLSLSIKKYGKGASIEEKVGISLQDRNSDSSGWHGHNFLRDRLFWSFYISTEQTLSKYFVLGTLWWFKVLFLPGSQEKTWFFLGFVLQAIIESQEICNLLERYETFWKFIF